MKERKEQPTTSKPPELEDGKRRDCCDNCSLDSTCEVMIDRCFHQAKEICANCERCSMFVNRFIGFRTAAEIMQEGGH